MAKKTGWVSPKPTVPIKGLEKNDLFLDDFYDEWQDHRDGFRAPFDNQKIRKPYIRYAGDLKIPKHNHKLKILNKRRKAMKYMEHLKTKTFK